MGWLERRRHRWSSAALEQIWAMETPSSGLGLGPGALVKTLSESESIRRQYQRLVEADVTLRGCLDEGAQALSSADVALLGLDADAGRIASEHPCADSGDLDFEARVHLYLAAAASPAKERRVWPVIGVVVATAAVAAVLLLLLGRGGVDSALVADAERDQEWRVRGAGGASPQVLVSGLCVGDKGGKPVVTPARVDSGGPLRCRREESLQVTMDNPEGRTYSVAMFVVTGERVLPFGPTPSSRAALVLKPVPGTQTVGPPRRLGVNLEAGRHELVVLVSAAPLEYSVLEQAMATWSALDPASRRNERAFSRAWRAQNTQRMFTVQRVALDVEP